MVRQGLQSTTLAVRRWLAGGAVALLSCHAAAQQGGPTALHYGDVLFDVYSERHFEALRHLEYFKAANRLPADAADLPLVRATLYGAYGVREEARRQLEAVTAGAEGGTLRNEARLHLAAMDLADKDYGALRARLAALDKRLSDDQRLRARRFRLAAAVGEGDFIEAQKVMARLPDDVAEVAYARYNLGVAYINAGDRERGLRWLDRLGRQDAQDEEVEALRDKANVLLGYLHLQSAELERAPRYFNRVRLDGPFANKALLGLGWSYSERQRFDQALNPWSALRERDPYDATVQEALLATPFAFDKLEAYRQALGQYHAAIDTYQLLNSYYQQLEQRIGNEGLRAVVLGELPLDPLGERIEVLARDRSSRPLTDLFADEEFQQAMAAYRDVLQLEAHLDSWRRRLMVYDQALEAMPQDQRPQAVTAREVERRVADIDRRLGILQKQHHRQQRVSGVLPTLFGEQPDADHDAVSANLKEVQSRLADTHRRWAMLKRAARTGGRNELRRELVDLQERLEFLGARVTGAAQDHERALTGLTLARLNERRRQVAGYLVQARYAVAQIYDQATGGPAQ